MAIFQQNLPASLRFGSVVPQENRGVSTSDRRPYLVTATPRRIVASNRKTVSSTRQFLALFPHESEDARLTGETRSLYRRLLALNLPRPAVRAEPVVEVTEMQFVSSDSRIA